MTSMATTKRFTVFQQEIDTSTGSFSTPISLPLSSTSFSLSFTELPCRCAPTMACIPILASLELHWTGFKGKPLEVRRGSLSFERTKGASIDRVSVGIKSGVFPDSPEGTIKASTFVGSGREKKVVIRLELEVEIEIENETTSLTRTSDLIEGRAVMDVCLVFPREQNRRLFASSKLLSEVSSYWKAQLSTRGFNELLETLDLTDDGLEESDSDFDEDVDELDAELANQVPIPSFIRTIPIYGTSYATYRALVTYLFTSQISFAPLSSSFPSRSAYRSSISLSRSLNPSLPSATSPKALYILSHFLSIPELSTLSLSAYISSLTIDNALIELFSGFVENYSEVRREIVQWILESGKGRWEVLRKSETVKEWSEKVRKEGITEGEMEILLMLSGIET